MAIISSQHINEIKECVCEFCGEYPFQYYCPELRERNCNLMNQFFSLNGEFDVKTVILGESPPATYRYIYDPVIYGGKKWFADWIIEILAAIPEYNNVSEKLRNTTNRLDYLKTLGAEGILIIDCCQCAVAHLKRSKAMELRKEVTLNNGKRKKMNPRKSAIVHCFIKQTRKILEPIGAKYEPKIVWAFPEGSKGKLPGWLQEYLETNLKTMKFKV